MYKSAQVFYVLTSLHWPSQSEIEMCKVEQHLYVKTASCHGRNAWKFQAGLQEAMGKHRNCIVQLQGKYRHSNVAVHQLPTSTAMDVAACQWL